MCNLLLQQLLLIGILKPHRPLQLQFRLQVQLYLLATSMPLLSKHFFPKHYSLFKVKSNTKYLAQDIVVTQLIIIYDFNLRSMWKLWQTTRNVPTIGLFDNIRFLQLAFLCKYCKKKFA